MQTLIINLHLFILLSIASIPVLEGQSSEKKTISDSEKLLISTILNDLAESDQLYRNKLAKGTLDDGIVAKIDSVFNNVGVREGLLYQQSLNLSLAKEVQDSLWSLQNRIDLQNHLALKGLWEVYGFIPKSVIEENNFVQILLLMHPPKDWDIPTYLAEYSSFLLDEVKAERMPAKTYAMFVDNIKGKILREPQIYGTNQQFDPVTKSILPPGIRNLTESNDARIAIGLPVLEEGQYRIVGEK